MTTIIHLPSITSHVPPALLPPRQLFFRLPLVIYASSDAFRSGFAGSSPRIHDHAFHFPSCPLVSLPLLCRPATHSFGFPSSYMRRMTPLGADSRVMIRGFVPTHSTSLPALPPASRSFAAPPPIFFYLPFVVNALYDAFGSGFVGSDPRIRDHHLPPPIPPTRVPPALLPPHHSFFYLPFVVNASNGAFSSASVGSDLQIHDHDHPHPLHHHPRPSHSFAAPPPILSASLCRICVV
jgi:hypothetical protein